MRDDVVLCHGCVSRVSGPSTAVSAVAHLSLLNLYTEHATNRLVLGLDEQRTMNRYDDLLARLRAHDLAGMLRPVAPDDLEQLKRDYPSVPRDYVDFLTQVGCGSFGDGNYMIYSGLVLPKSIFGAGHTHDLRDLLIFGDDFQGYCAAFDPTNKWVVVEIEPTTSEPTPKAATFEQFIRKVVAHLCED